MKQYNANVLAKGQVVIPKELRDELEINVWDSLSCFTRGSAIILKKKINTTSYSSNSDWNQIPLWVDSNGKIQTISTDQLKWITCLLWKAWCGKSVHALNMMMNMYNSWKSIIVFDPYGDLSNELKNYVSDLWEPSIYEYVLGDTWDRWTIKQKIIENKKQKVIMIQINYQGIWERKAVDLIRPIILDCYNKIADDNTSIYMDEFSAYYDEELRSNIINSSAFTCILDQWWEKLSRDQVKHISKSINHIAIYQIWWLTAKYLIDDLDISKTIQELRTIEKYHFYFHSKLDKEAGKILTWVYPLN